MADQSAEVNKPDSSQMGETSPNSPLQIETKLSMHDVYVLSSGDHPGLNLTSDLLTSSNYSTWSLDILLALEARGKDRFITGVLPKPEVTDPDYMMWKKNDAMIRAWIKNSMLPELQRSFAYVTSAKDLWDNIKEKYGQRNGILLSKLKKNISNFTQRNLTLTDYYTQLHNLMNELENMEPKCRCVCEARLDTAVNKERDRMIQFVNGLNETYEAVKNQLLLMEPLPSMSKAYGLILQIEQQREHGLHFEMNVLNLAQKEFSLPKKLLEKKKIEKKNLICEFCKKRGHRKDTCFKIHGTPDWFKEMIGKKPIMKANNAVIGNSSKPGTETKNEGVVPSEDLNIKDLIRAEVQRMMHTAQETPVDFSNMLIDYAGNLSTCKNDKPDDSSIWILDSGASCHIGTQKNLFSNLTPIKNKPLVYLPDGSTCSPKFTGSVQLTSRITLHNVYFIPDFKFNLISVSTLLLSNDLVLTFYPLVCIIQDLHSKAEVGRAHQQGNLYFIYSIIPPPPLTVANSDVIAPISNHCNELLWHQRLGHASDDVLNHLDFGIKFQCKPCDSCHKAKQHRTSFHKNAVSAEHLFDLIHMDLWGPYSLPTSSGCNYFLTVVDDHSRSTWIFLLQDKTNIHKHLETFVLSIKTQFNSTIKSIRTDNGSEFLNRQCQSIINSHWYSSSTHLPSFTPTKWPC